LFNPHKFYFPLPSSSATVIGTAAIVFSGIGAAPYVNRALAWRPVVFLGLISYSLYLWHWPVIVFFRYYLVHDLDVLEVAASVLLMTAFAFVSWRFVERPFRSRKISIRFVLLCSVAAVAVLGVAAFVFVHFHGLPRRLNPQAAVIDEAVGTNFRCDVQDYFALGISRACTMNLPSRNPADAQIALFGNSHAQMYAPVWSSLFVEHGLKGLLLPANGCLPVVAVNIDSACFGIARRNLASLIGLNRVSIVVIGMTWNNSLYDQHGDPITQRRDTILAAAIDDVIADLRRAGKKIILIGPLPMPGYDIASTLSRAYAFGRPTASYPTSMSTHDYDARFGFLLHHFTNRADVDFVRPDAVQLRNGRYQFLLDGRSMFADSSHLAAAELWRYREPFDAALRRALAHH
jgi:hypothetical protein